MMAVIQAHVVRRHPIYQTSALIVLGRYGLHPNSMKINVSQGYEKYVSPQFADMVTSLIRNYFIPRKGLLISSSQTAKLQDAEIVMLEKLLKKTRCIDPKKSG